MCSMGEHDIAWATSPIRSVKIASFGLLLRFVQASAIEYVSKSKLFCSEFVSLLISYNFIVH